MFPHFIPISLPFIYLFFVLPQDVLSQGPFLIPLAFPYRDGF